MSLVAVRRHAGGTRDSNEQCHPPGYYLVAFRSLSVDQTVYKVEDAREIVNQLNPTGYNTTGGLEKNLRKCTCVLPDVCTLCRRLLGTIISVWGQSKCQKTQKVSAAIMDRYVGALLLLLASLGESGVESDSSIPYVVLEFYDGKKKGVVAAPKNWVLQEGDKMIHFVIELAVLAQIVTIQPRSVTRNVSCPAALPDEATLGPNGLAAAVAHAEMEPEVVLHVEVDHAAEAHQDVVLHSVARLIVTETRAAHHVIVAAAVQGVVDPEAAVRGAIDHVVEAQSVVDPKVAVLDVVEQEAVVRDMIEAAAHIAIGNQVGLRDILKRTNGLNNPQQSKDNTRNMLALLLIMYKKLQKLIKLVETKGVTMENREPENDIRADDVKTIAGINLPLNRDDFDNLNKLLQENDVIIQLKKIMAYYKKDKAYNHAKAIMYRSCEDEIGCNFNWHGKKGKKSLSDTLFAKTLLDVMREKHPTSTEDDAVNGVKYWLRHAPSRKARKEKETEGDEVSPLQLFNKKFMVAKQVVWCGVTRRERERERESTLQNKTPIVTLLYEICLVCGVSGMCGAAAELGGVLSVCASLGVMRGMLQQEPRDHGRRLRCTGGIKSRERVDSWGGLRAPVVSGVPTTSRNYKPLPRHAESKPVTHTSPAGAQIN
ncbi:hypothetical protein B566_EDAN010619 [Ephemera danica]|nr:hypothetical protein B566_EDAN010619 [Ephemera danica]